MTEKKNNSRGAIIGLSIIIALLIGYIIYLSMNKQTLIDEKVQLGIEKYEVMKDLQDLVIDMTRSLGKLRVSCMAVAGNISANARSRDVKDWARKIHLKAPEKSITETIKNNSQTKNFILNEHLIH